jgi:hypothetical protein
MQMLRSDRTRALAAAVVALCLAVNASAQSQTERGEVAWKAGTTFALQGNADSALASFRTSQRIAEAVHDSSLLSAALRGAAEVQSVYKGCSDSALLLLQHANDISIAGDRIAGQLLVRRLAAAGKLPDARALQVALYADIKDQVPRSISRESVNFLMGQAAIQRAAGQDQAAFTSLVQGRDIADRLANGDDKTQPKMPFTTINSVNYWVSFEMAQLMLNTKSKGVGSLADGKSLMDAIANNTDNPEDGNERRFSVFRLADRLTVNAWRCTLRGERCAVPKPPKCK